MAGKGQIHRATVEGFGAFPVDMLRYDECFPTTEHDSAVITQENDRRQVSVSRIGSRPPGLAFTPARWDSFGWKVIKVEI